MLIDFIPRDLGTELILLLFLSAAPGVAGVLANAMSMPTVPWVDDSTTDETFAKQAMEWMKQEYSWDRIPNVNVLWNGVKKADYIALGLPTS